MTRPIVPMSDMSRRVQEHGRIRVGVKGPKGAPKAIDTFRFTSSDHAAIEAIAGIYGGIPVAFTDGKTPNQMDVTTEAKEITVALPPDPLSGTPVYELWSKGGCQRRCDGVTCAIPQTTPDGSEIVDVPCICDRTKTFDCKPITRLNVILPDIRFGGTWRLETKGWNAAHELPGMVDLVLSLQERGLVRALLALEPRVSVNAGRTQRFVVPAIRVGHSLDALSRGDARLGRLESSGDLRSDQIAELGWAGAEHSDDQPRPVADVQQRDGVPEGDLFGPEGDAPAPTPHIVDVEVIDTQGEGGPDARLEAVELRDSGPQLHGGGEGREVLRDPQVHDDEPVGPAPRRTAELQQISFICRSAGLNDDDRHALALRVSKGRTPSTRELTDEERTKLLAFCREMEKGGWVYDGVDEHGQALLRRP